MLLRCFLRSDMFVFDLMVSIFFEYGLGAWCLFSVDMVGLP